MGAWSQLAGDDFLNWLAPDTGWRWLDIGCGNGAFTEMLANRYAPSSLHGIDPSDAQLTYARARPALRNAHLRLGDAMALPYPADTLDAAVMPLVIFFVPNPATGVSEMVRVVRPGGVVAVYAWDMDGGGFPYDALFRAMHASGVDVPQTPSPEASRLDVLQELWRNAGLDAIDTQVITVQRTFVDFDDYWTTVLDGPSVGALLAAMSADDVKQLTSRLRAELTTDATGAITCTARAHAVRGRVVAHTT